jgi:flagellar motility protein MotE (MotC chaperone)
MMMRPFYPNNILFLKIIFNKDVEYMHKENVQPPQIINNIDNSVTNNTTDNSVNIDELKQLLKDIEKLTIDKLKPLLEKYGLSKTGNKQKQVDKLRQYINEKINTT